MTTSSYPPVFCDAVSTSPTNRRRSPTKKRNKWKASQRRVRITAGNIDQLRQIKDLLWPPQPLVLFCFLSYKAARLAVPLGLIGVFATSILLRHSPFYAWALALQILFYGLALLGGVLPLRPRFLRLPFYFCMINASLFGWLFYRALGRARGTAWR